MMLMPVSTEFAALCQSQISLMAKVVGADSTSVYLAESWSTPTMPKLIPIATYPPASYSSSDQRPNYRALPETLSSAEKDDSSKAAFTNPSLRDPSFLTGESLLSAHRKTQNTEQSVPQRIAIPMMHDGGVFGVLVCWKSDRPWQTQERDHMEECARALTLAWVLDQRGQWLKAQMSSLKHIQSQQSDRFHELLHQLRSPLTALKTFGKLLTKRLPKEDNNQLLVVNMLRESDRMQELLGYFDDTLQAADETREETSQTLPLLAPAEDNPAILDAEVNSDKAESLTHFGGTLIIQPFSVAALMAPLIELTRTLAETADMTLHIVPATEEIWVQADERALMEILNNFLDNSLKYSPAGTHLWIQWGLSQPGEADLAGIVVGDTGPGIPQADQVRIFERHYRGIQASGDLDGSGLGLAIAQDLVQEMNGNIELYSPIAQLPWSLPAAVQTLPDVTGTAFALWLPTREESRSRV